MSSTEHEPQKQGSIFNIINKRLTKEIGAVIISTDVSEKQKTQLTATITGKIPVIAIKGASLATPNVLSKLETLYEVTDLKTNTMNYFAPEALLRGLNDGFTPVMKQLKLNVAPIEGFFELLSYFFPRVISESILTTLIALESVGSSMIDLSKDNIVVGSSSRSGNIDSVIILRSIKIRNLFDERNKPLVKEILKLPKTD